MSRNINKLRLPSRALDYKIVDLQPIMLLKIVIVFEIIIIFSCVQKHNTIKYVM